MPVDRQTDKKRNADNNTSCPYRGRSENATKCSHISYWRVTHVKNQVVLFKSILCSFNRVNTLPTGLPIPGLRAATSVLRVFSLYFLSLKTEVEECIWRNYWLDVRKFFLTTQLLNATLGHNGVFRLAWTGNLNILCTDNWALLKAWAHLCRQCYSVHI